MSPYSDEQVRASAQLQRYAEQRRVTSDNIALAVRDARDLGISWSQIGNALGTSAQAAWERYGLTVEQRRQRSLQNNPAVTQPSLFSTESDDSRRTERLEP